jgi:hypothetical protein
MLVTLVYLLVILIVLGLGWWVLQQIPLPPPIQQIALVVWVVVCAIVLIVFLLNLVGSGPLVIR